MTSPASAPQYPVIICMGSQSDFDTMKGASEMLDALGVGYDMRIISAHRTPQRLADFASNAAEEGVKVIIAGAGGAAHLPGMIASFTHLPVLGVPVKSKALNGMDSLLSIVQMPAGIAVGTLAIGEAGAKNAGLLAAQILALGDTALTQRLIDWRASQTDSVASYPEQS
jgi:5-(carboxyamino)imidazole ribonucleotide mutase